LKQKKHIYGLLPEDLQKYLCSDDSITEIEYPNTAFPTKITSQDFEKEPLVSGKLTAIKGQYLIFNIEKVINIRKFGGYNVKVLV
jgi:hypothetical protein